MTYQGYNRQAFERSSSTTLAKHITEVEDAIRRNFKFLALLESAGRVSFNHSGEGFDWPVRYRIHNVEGNTGETPRRFERRNLWKKAKGEFRGYQATDMMYEKEFQSNKGPEGIIKVFNGMTTRIDESIRYVMGTQFFNDGSLPQNADFWEGLETLFKTNGTLNITDGTQRTANAADKVGYPDGEYAGIDMELGFYGGDNQAGLRWPDGVADPEFDFWSPLVVCYDSTAFSGSSHTFLLQGREAMRYGMLAQQRNGTLEDQLTQFWLAKNLYNDFLNSNDSKEEIQVQSNYSLRALGFTSVMFDGVEVTWEATVPADRGYGISLMNTELLCMYPTLLVPEGPEWSMDDQAYRAVVSTLSNLKYKSPRNYLALKKYTATAPTS